MAVDGNASLSHSLARLLAALMANKKASTLTKCAYSLAFQLEMEKKASYGDLDMVMALA